MSGGDADMSGGDGDRCGDASLANGSAPKSMDCEAWVDVFRGLVCLPGAAPACFDFAANTLCRFGTAPGCKSAPCSSTAPDLLPTTPWRLPEAFDTAPRCVEFIGKTEATVAVVVLLATAIAR